MRMPRIRTSVAVLLVFLTGSAAPAQAQTFGVALAWDRCYGEGTGSSLRQFACNTNAGEETLVGSLMVPIDMPEITGLELVVDLWPDAGGFYPHPVGLPIPEWWHFKNPGSCRLSALSLSTATDQGNQVCQDMGLDQAVSVVVAYEFVPGSGGHARLKMIAAMPTSLPASAQVEQEYQAFTLRIRHDKTVGDGACEGCATPMFLYLSQINVATPGNSNNTYLYNGLAPNSQYVVWSPVPVPTRRSSWASVKSRYR